MSTVRSVDRNTQHKHRLESMSKGVRNPTGNRQKTTKSTNTTINSRTLPGPKEFL